MKKNTIRHNLVRISMLTAGAALLISLLAVSAYSLLSYRSTLARNLIVQAKIIASNSSAAILFNDRKNAEETLSALGTVPHIVSAVLYTKDGDIFATYKRHGSHEAFLRAPAYKEGHQFNNDQLFVLQPVNVDNEKIGSILIKSDMKEFYVYLALHTVVIVMVVLISLFVATLLSTKLNRTITNPIADLVGLMKNVSEGRDYSIRAVTRGPSELHYLSEGFNEMLKQIQQRDLDLELNRQHLEEVVDMRTVELAKANKELKQELTERKQAEEDKEKLQAQLLQAQKMEAIGHLAGGVAHDFNNILTAIVGYAHILLMRTKNDDPLRRNIEYILIASEKAANLTKSLLAFSRKQIMQVKTVNINDIVLRMIKILDRIIGEDINLRVNTTVHDLIVNVDTNQIEQVIMNLATNARDAMPGGGILTVTTEEFEIDKNYIQMHREGEAGKYAVLSVTDTGMGMDEKTREHIFDPFFTTKEVGKGTGLGLAMIFGTIKQHNGFINVYSEPGEGTTFKVYIPLAETGVKVTEEKAAGSIHYGTETVLLVEDDKYVRKVTKVLLKEYGYSVIEAIDGKHAVELYRENRDRIHLVITDIIMPGQNGKDLHDELMKIAADIKIIFVSGYPADVLAKQGIIDSDVNFMSKPVNPEILLQKIRDVLEK